MGLPSLFKNNVEIRLPDIVQYRVKILNSIRIGIITDLKSVPLSEFFFYTCTVEASVL